MHYHQSLATRQRALIVDIGGGTTDVAQAELGAGQAPQILRSWGLPKGGTDLDVGISLRSFMPPLGRNVTEVPPHHFIEAASVYNLPKQREFRKQDYRFVAEPYAARLRALQEPGATTRLNQLAERAKIALSAEAAHHAPLDFIEPGLAIAADRGNYFDHALAPFLSRNCNARWRRCATNSPSYPPQSVLLALGGTHLALAGGDGVCAGVLSGNHAGVRRPLAGRGIRAGGSRRRSGPVVGCRLSPSLRSMFFCRSPLAGDAPRAANRNKRNGVARERYKRLAWLSVR